MKKIFFLLTVGLIFAENSMASSSCTVTDTVGSISLRCGAMGVFFVRILIPIQKYTQYTCAGLTPGATISCTYI